MNFFISDALAQGAGGSGGGLLGLLPMVAIFVIFYFLLIRPQQKKAKEHRAMVAELSKGDEVVTNGGVLGKVTGGDDNFLQVQRLAVSQMMPKGTVKDTA